MNTTPPTHQSSNHGWLHHFIFTLKSLCIILFLIEVCLGQNVDLRGIFDPNEHKDIQPNWPVRINTILPEENALDSILTPDTVQFISEGFRVQVLASKSMSKADSLTEILNSFLEDSVYIVYEIPNYKVRVGDFITRNNAEKMRRTLYKMGFETGWVVQSRIIPKKVGER